MKFRIVKSVTPMILFATLVIPGGLVAQENEGGNHKHHHYKVIDMGTFGGPTSSTQDELQVLNRRGEVVGGADTSIPNHPNACVFCDGPFITHAFQWRNGVLNDLGALPGDNSSGANWISDSGLVAGGSETVDIDPLFGGIRALHAVVWKNGQITDLGTLEGGYESDAFAVNSRGQVAGAAFNAAGHQHPFLWEHGMMRDLGTLGGPDAGLVGSFKGNVEMNERGQVVACSDTNSTINPVTGTPTVDPFLWDKEQGMIDLGTLGGTSGCAIYLNNRGQVVGYSNVAGDLTFHPFLWDRGVIKDLGTLGGTMGFANWISDAGEVAGTASNQGDQALHAFLWKNGIMTDLGTLPGDPCSGSQAVNSKGQMVGESQGVCPPQASRTRAFLWENGGPMVDLNSLILSGSGVQLVFGAVDINDRGEIVGVGVLPNSDSHAVILIPCDENHPDVEGCDYSMVDASAMLNVTPTSASLSQVAPRQSRSESPSEFNPVLRFGQHPSPRNRVFRPQTPTPILNSQPEPPMAEVKCPGGAVAEGNSADQLVDSSSLFLRGHCIENFGKLTGSCAMSLFVAPGCYVQPSTNCPRGAMAKNRGLTECCGRLGCVKITVDLAAGCLP